MEEGDGHGENIQGQVNRKAGQVLVLDLGDGNMGVQFYNYTFKGRYMLCALFFM